MVANSLYGYPNFYGSNYGTDFMSQAVFGNNQAQQLALYQAFAQQNGQPQTDTFEKSGSSSFGTGLKIGATAGIGTGAGAYFFGNGPVDSEGKFADSVLSTLEKDQTKTIEKNTKALLKKETADVLTKHGVKAKSVDIEAIEKYIELTEAGETVPKKVLDKVPAELKGKKNFKACKAFAEDFAAIDVESIKAQVTREAKLNTLAGKVEQLKGYQSVQNKLANTTIKNKTELKEFFIENAKVFGLEGNEKQIEKQAADLVKKIGSKGKLTRVLEAYIPQLQGELGAYRGQLNTQASKYYNSAARSMKKNAPEALSKAFKNFKWQKAGKMGAIAAGAGVVLGWLFGGK